MFCFQCEQTAKGEGCTVRGVCGKPPETAALQDLLIYTLKGLSQVALAADALGLRDREADVFTAEACFATLTNVSFDPERIAALVHKCVKHRDALATLIKNADGTVPIDGPAGFKPADSTEEMIKQGEEHGVKDYQSQSDDIHSLKETLVYGLKGLAAYADHARILGKEDPEVFRFIHKGLAATLREDLSLEDALDLVMECGKTNLRAMELLDAANTETYGHPTPTEVPLGHRKAKAIVVSGHDLRDLHMLLEQTKGKGIDIYTHGEMLPCHGYPKLKEYDHFFGHYGTAWQNQIKEFPEFPGPVLMTTNCIQKPAESYKGAIFTTGLVSWPGVEHIDEDENGWKDFSPVIDKALEMPGFQDDQDKGTVMVGFGHNAVMGVADKVIEAVKNGDIRHFFLVAGCDGAKPGRNYYTEFVEKVPEDCVVLTLACGKFRFFDKKLGDIGGIPRLLDVGQCNDAYSAIQIALALSNAFECDVNELPLSMVLSWYEQKAVAILLTLLSLGIKDIRLGPSLPAFLTPNVLNHLVENFNIQPIGDPEKDLQAILG